MVVEVLRAWGMPEDMATTTADVMVDTDLSGVDSHGVSMLVSYEQLLAQDRLALGERPEVEYSLPAFATVDGRHGLGHPVGVLGMRTAIEKARVCGIGAVAARRSHHFGALGYYARLASDEGFIGFVTTSTRTPAVPPTGSSAPLLGTNPLCFAAPRAGGRSLVVDMSTSVVAVNKVKAHWLKGLELPRGWVVDDAGNPMTDARLAFESLQAGKAGLAPLGGATTSSGGHKGYGLSLMVQVLSTMLATAGGTAADPGHDNIGHFFLAISPRLVDPGGDLAGAVELMCTRVTRDASEVLIPGEPEQRARAVRSERGIPMGEILLEQLEGICARAGVAPLLTPRP